MRLSQLTWLILSSFLIPHLPHAQAQRSSTYQGLEWSELTTCESDPDLIQRLHLQFQSLLNAIEVFRSENEASPQNLRRLTRARAKRELCRSLLEPLGRDSIFFESFIQFTQRKISEEYSGQFPAELVTADLQELNERIGYLFFHESVRPQYFKLSNFCSDIEVDRTTRSEERRDLENFMQWTGHFTSKAPEMLEFLQALEERLEAEQP
jgi:hypothetical protein